MQTKNCMLFLLIYEIKFFVYCAHIMEKCLPKILMIFLINFNNKYHFHLIISYFLKSNIFKVNLSKLPSNMFSNFFKLKENIFTIIFCCFTKNLYKKNIFLKQKTFFMKNFITKRKFFNLIQKK